MFGIFDKAGDEPGGARYTRRRARLNSRVSGARLPKEQSMVLDVTLLAVMLISALLAMVRGFMREVLSIASWAAAAVAALYFHKRLIPVVKEYITTNHTVALAISVVAIFFVTLLVVAVITIKISDTVLDSRIGALDRTLGFVRPGYAAWSSWWWHSYSSPGWSPRKLSRSGSARRNRSLS